MDSWRDRCRPVVAKAIREGRAMGLEGKELRNHVQAHYPFGQREYHPYKIWLDELKRQLGDKSPPPEDLSSYWTDLIGVLRGGG